MDCYIGNKGYTIYKKSITDKELLTIKETLTVSPYSPMTISKPPVFPVYRENNDKIYIPRFIGNDMFGIPINNKLKKPDSVYIPFKGEVRDYQTTIIDTFMENASQGLGGGLLEIPCGRGKTVMALNIISQLKTKTLVIVHKGFLLNQWVERIQQFLPTARIGTIQGKTVDVDDKDIVLGMLQSISMKDYPKNIFDSFGLTIIDEVHHIAAEVFVRSLFKVVSPTMLGLSATMNRKDGLSFVFKMFIGPVIYKEKREANHDVLVKAYHYETDDQDFNDVILDYRGNPAYSSMISKLCNYEPRSEFIISILRELINNDTGGKTQIIVLAQNRSVLNHIYDSILKEGFSTVGYYLGGMKEQHLKASEDKQIIIGTYSMASEALDIKSLTTLLMVTPKTSIEQSVGRILRTRHSQPLVIDIVDQHDLFRRQFKKRMAFYKKNKYRVIESISHSPYQWNTIYDAKEIIKKDKSSTRREPFTNKCCIELSSL